MHAIVGGSLVWGRMHGFQARNIGVHILVEVNAAVRKLAELSSLLDLCSGDGGQR